jgi:putative ABC transport system permease protein
MTIALGVGANTAIFSVVHAYMLEPLPIASPDRVFGLLKSMGDQLNLTSAPNYLDIRESSESFEHLAAVHLWSSTRR